ncbi:MAG: asparaginase [Alphaproteobacteria bacterium]|nr:asparaginase [Alphaproteobacteria bacterium]
MIASFPQPPGPAPLLVEVTRGGFVESRHHVICAITDGQGALLAAWGDVEMPVSPRSACKPLQQIALVESGAADAFGLSAEELALACASHSGQKEHVARVRDWLARLGLGEADLECGAHYPYHEPSAQELWRAATRPTQLHNNCSGKHAGFLTLARHLDLPTRGYVEKAHPVQQQIATVMGEMTGAPLRDAPWGPDGCGIPTYAFPLAALAHGLSRMAAPDGLAPARAAACRRLLDAMGGQPLMVAGEGRFDTAVMRATGARIVTKGGAEGVHVAAIRERGWGLAVKSLDGAARAADAATAAVLDWLGLLGPAEQAALAPFRRQRLATRRGIEAGFVRMAEAGF